MDTTRPTFTYLTGAKNKKGLSGRFHVNKDHCIINLEHGITDDPKSSAEKTYVKGTKRTTDAAHNYILFDLNSLAEYFEPPHRKLDGNPGNKAGDRSDTTDSDHLNKEPR